MLTLIKSLISDTVLSRHLDVTRAVTQGEQVCEKLHANAKFGAALLYASTERIEHAFINVYKSVDE